MVSFGLAREQSKFYLRAFKRHEEIKEKQDFLEEEMMYRYCSVRLCKHSCKSPCRVKLLYGVFIIHLDGYLFIYL